jgi:putative Mg2+ transporter-C (MgtC) family protein
MTVDQVIVEKPSERFDPGLRTHMLVCVGSTLIMIVSAYGFSDVLGSRVVLDPSRTAAQVVSGIGFLGAGAILARGRRRSLHTRGRGNCDYSDHPCRR